MLDMNNLNEVGMALRSWNSDPRRKSIQISLRLLQETFFRKKQQQPELVQIENLLFFLKKEEGLLRVHFVSSLKEGELFQMNKAINGTVFLKAELVRLAREKGCSKVTFGGGEHHIFPGVPLEVGLDPWLNVFDASGAMVWDYEGALANASSGVLSDIGSLGESRSLRNPQDETELGQLIHFVQREFPGRWTSEIEEDSRLGLVSKYYFGYFLEKQIVGYARLYGWEKGYWAPGVLFAGPGNGAGGLGPIGVAKSMQGRGIGTDLLAKCWDVLLEKGCKRVRIDWTTEKKFYERRGLIMVQKYQPAKIEVV